MDDADAAAAVFDAMVQEPEQLPFGFIAVESVQIDFGIQSVIASAQFLQDVLLQAGSDEAEFVFKAEHFIDNNSLVKKTLGVDAELSSGNRFRFSKAC